MRKYAFLGGAALLLAATASQAQHTDMTPPDMAAQPATPAEPAMPADPGEMADDPNADAMPAPVANDPTMIPATPGVPHDSTARPGSAANPIVEGGNMTVPPPPKAEYPMCSATVTDHCMQARDKRWNETGKKPE